MKKNKTNLKQDAWSAYWAAWRPTNGTCLPDLPADLSQFLQNIWRDFFDRLPKNSAVLEVGCGSAALLGIARKQRPDLELVGIDYADALPDCGKGITLHCGIDMAHTPFDDGAFTAVIGQFALEYGHEQNVAFEMKRLVGDSGFFQFICHHAQGVVVHDNLARKSAIRACLRPGGMVEVGLKAVRGSKKNLQKTTQQLARIFENDQCRYPGQSVIGEVGRDLAGILAGPGSLTRLLELRKQLNDEVTRINALQQAALSETEITALAAQLDATGSSCPPLPHVIYTPHDNLPFAWLLTSQTASQTPY